MEENKKEEALEVEADKAEADPENPDEAVKAEKEAVTEENVSLTEEGEQAAQKKADSDYDDGFTDAPKKVEEQPKAPETKIEEETQTVDIHKQKEEGEEEVLVRPSERSKNGDIAYTDPRFENIEKARKSHVKFSKKWSHIKVGITLGAVALVIGTWLVIRFGFPSAGEIAAYVSLGVAILSVAGIAVFGIFQKKKTVKSTEDYLTAYFDNSDAFLFDGLPAQNIQGGLKDKVTADEFNAADLYGACSKHEEPSNVGSRDSKTFEYEGMKCALADVGAEARNPKGFLTVFIGKYLRTENHLDVKDGGLFVYFKGNARATPPSLLFQKDANLIEDHKKYCVYGAKENKKLITPELRKAFKEIHTDNLLIDLAISFKSGKTYWALGYEDTLMVAPVDKPFDPVYLQKFKEHLTYILNLAKTL